MNNEDTAEHITASEVLVELKHHISKLRETTYDLALVNARTKTIDALTNLLGILTVRET